MNKKFCWIVICIAAIAGCSKSKDSAPSCNIITITSDGDDPTSFSYNKEGKPVEINYGNYKTAFTYSGNTTSILQTNNGVFRVKWTVQLNAQGLVEKVRSQTDASGTTWVDQVYLYDAGQLKKVTSVNHNGVVSRVASYTWHNGNPVLISYSNGDPDIIMEYYTDKPHDPKVKLVEGEYWDGAPPKNLLKMINFSGEPLRKTYEFDAAGKVTAQTVTEGSNTTRYKYTYDCSQ